MKKEFSTKWKASSKPRKKRKYAAKAPLHLKRKLSTANLSKDLRKKVDKRNVVIRKGDKVKVMRGKYKGNAGKVTLVDIKKSKVYIENVQTTKMDGSKVEVPLRPSNLQITELYEEDTRRFGKKTETPKKVEQKEKGKEKENKKEVNEEIKNKTKKKENKK